MASDVTFGEKVAHWAQSEKWSGFFKVEWLFVKDVPNREFKSIIIPSNESKPVTNSRDTQEVPFAQGMKMLGIFKKYAATSSLLDEFEFYDKEERDRKSAPTPESFGRLPSGKSRGEYGRYRGRRPRSRGQPRGRGQEDVELASGDATVPPAPAPESTSAPAPAPVRGQVPAPKSTSTAGTAPALAPVPASGTEGKTEGVKAPTALAPQATPQKTQTGTKEDEDPKPSTNAAH